MQRRSTRPKPVKRGAPARLLPMRAAVGEFRGRYLLRALAACGGDMRKAAKMLAISLATAYRIREQLESRTTASRT